MASWLHRMGISSSLLYGASILSIVLSLAMWFVPRGGGREQEGRPERLAIFVGLWPPTLALLGHAVEEEEHADNGG